VTTLRSALVIVALAIPYILLSQTSGSREMKPATFSDIANILPSQCEWCHGWENHGSKAGYYMGTYGGLMDGPFRNGNFQRAIVPGDAENSPFVQFIEGRKQPRMPLGREPLRKERIELIRRWIDNGARPDRTTSKEHVIVMDGISVDKQNHSFWLSCRAPKDLQNIGLRVKVIDEATGKVVAYEWPQHAKDLNGRWNQWKIEVPVAALKLPGSVAVALYVSNGWAAATADLTQEELDKDESGLDGVIFLLEAKQTPDDELLKQKDFRTVPQPQNPPHQNIRFQYVLRAASDLMLTVKPEGGGSALFLWSDKDLPARKILETTWKLGSAPSLKTGWYFARMRCTSREASVFQPDLAILFRVVR